MSQRAHTLPAVAQGPKRDLDAGWEGPPATNGILLLADVSGYSEYLRDTELQHAQNVLADLTEVIVEGVKPVFQLSKLEGDAVFAYAMADAVNGAILLDVIEETYFAFRRRVRDVDLSTSCDCNACRLIPSLDLKFIVHAGEFVISEVAGSPELTGPTVVLAHRLLKNTVKADLGLDAYALLTEPCVNLLGLDPKALGLTEHIDTYDVIGTVTCYVEDLQTRWEFEKERRQVFVTPSEAAMEGVWVSGAPVSTLWEYTTSPEKRLQWQTLTAIDQSNKEGRMGVGTTNHCKHGKGEIVEEILDWRPYRYYTIRSEMPVLGHMVVTFEFRQLPDGGSELHMRPERVGGLKRLAWMAMAPMMRRDLDKNMSQLVTLAAEKQ